MTWGPSENPRLSPTSHTTIDSDALAERRQAILASEICTEQTLSAGDDGVESVISKTLAAGTDTPDSVATVVSSRCEDFALPSIGQTLYRNVTTMHARTLR